MQKRLVLILLLMFVVGCTLPTEEIIQEVSVQDIEESVADTAVGTEEPILSEDVDEMIVEESSDEFIGPGGCTGDSCNEYFQNNPEESQKWCDENPVKCDLLRQDQSFEGPNGCTDDCDQFCDSNAKECQEWCKFNPEKNPELCGFILMQEDTEQREGDGIWEKKELSFFIKDEENVLIPKKRKIIIETITSTKEGSGGFYGWNSALAEINNKYPDNDVPDRLIEVDDENEADVVISVHSLKEFCCDLTGDPITGKERSLIGENSVKISSNVDIYNIVKIDDGFLSDMMRHELGHTLGIFGHIVDRQNDLMSIVSPASVIKDGNLNDLYIKYRDRIIETMEESIEKDESVADRKVQPPS